MINTNVALVTPWCYLSHCDSVLRSSGPFTSLHLDTLTEHLLNLVLHKVLEVDPHSNSVDLKHEIKALGFIIVGSVFDHVVY